MYQGGVLILYILSEERPDILCLTVCALHAVSLFFNLG